MGRVDVWRLALPHPDLPGAVRAILARHAGCDPGDVVLDKLERGKPVLASPPCGLHFNLTHTDGLALVAVTPVGRVGVDAERLGRRVRWQGISRRWFAPREAAEIRSAEDFLRAWVRKEAVVKLTGEGLAQLRGVEVTVAGPPAVVGAAGWALRDVEVPEGWIAAVAVEGEIERLTVRDWR